MYENENALLSLFGSQPCEQLAVAVTSNRNQETYFSLWYTAACRMAYYCLYSQVLGHRWSNIYAHVPKLSSYLFPWLPPESTMWSPLVFMSIMIILFHIKNTIKNNYLVLFTLYYPPLLPLMKLLGNVWLTYMVWDKIKGWILYI